MCSGRCWDVILAAEHLPVCQCNEEEAGSRWASVEYNSLVMGLVS